MCIQPLRFYSGSPSLEECCKAALSTYCPATKLSLLLPENLLGLDAYSVLCLLVATATRFEVPLLSKDVAT